MLGWLGNVFGRFLWVFCRFSLWVDILGWGVVLIVVVVCLDGVVFVFYWEFGYWCVGWGV